MEKNSNIPNQCLSCEFFSEKHEDFDLPDRCWLEVCHDVHFAFQKCGGVFWKAKGKGLNGRFI